MLKTMKITAVIWIILWALFGNSQNPAPKGAASLSVLVWYGGVGLPGAVVSLSSNSIKMSQVTNGSGEAKFKNLPPGVYEVKASFTGFTTRIQPGFKIKSGENAKLTLVMEPAGQLEEMLVVMAEPVTSNYVDPVMTDVGFRQTFADSAKIEANSFFKAMEKPLSTFSIDVDTAAYAFIRAMVREGELPDKDTIRIEELINYFSYEDPAPQNDNPIGVKLEFGPAPWNPEHRLVRIGLKAREIPVEERPSCNLVFLLDVSGSMIEPKSLPLVKDAMSMLADNLGERDRISIVVYAGDSGVALQPTRGDNTVKIKDTLYDLQGGGGTNGSKGIELAYELAQKSFIPGGVNRVILATDGDFNLGVTDKDSLEELIEEKAKSGVFLTVLGVGGQFSDKTLELLAARGNGNYGYIDTLEEARKILVDEIGGTLISVAKDVKLQVEFNPQEVGSYRLIGYENRLLNDEDFNDETVDAGDMGAGHSVCALYELIPPAKDRTPGKIDPLKYQDKTLPNESRSGEALTVKIRYKNVDNGKSGYMEVSGADQGQSLSATSNDFRFAAAVAVYGMILRDSTYVGKFSLDDASELAVDAVGYDPFGYRSGLLDLLEKTRKLKK